MYKSKYSRYFKIKLAILYSEEESSGELAERFHVGASHIRYWGEVFALQGATSFVNPQPNPSASDRLLILRKNVDE
jgi:hypothetical protein